MRILYVHNRYLQSMGGEDTTVESECELMRSRGHDVRLLLFDNATIAQGPVGRLKAGIDSIYSRRSAALLRKTAKEFAPDIIHVHNFYFSASPSVIIEGKKLGIPVIVTIQNFRLICANCLLLRDNKVCELCVSHRFPWYGVKYKCYHNSAIQSAVVGSIAAVNSVLGTWRNKVDRYITPAEFTLKRLVNSSLNVPENKFTVKRNFIPDPSFEITQREDFYLFVGRISEEKGVRVMLDAFKNMPHKKLRVAGDGPEFDEVKKDYGQLANVEFLGRQERQEVLSLMKRCRALIFPSVWYEGSPLTIIESFAVGTPVIASAVGSMKEMVTHNRDGLLFVAGSSEDLISKINEFEALNSDGFNTNARNTYLEKYHPDKCYEAVMKIYQEAIGRQTIG